MQFWQLVYTPFCGEKKTGVPSALFFIDLKAAFHSVELVLGPALGGDIDQQILQQPGMIPVCAMPVTARTT